jgi:hypothetical protein
MRHILSLRLCLDASLMQVTMPLVEEKWLRTSISIFLGTQARQKALKTWDCKANAKKRPSQPLPPSRKVNPSCAPILGPIWTPIDNTVSNFESYRILLLL